HAQTDLRARQGIEHFRLDLFFARRAVVAMNRVFGDDRLDDFGNVFDDAGPHLFATLQGPAAIGTNIETMFDVLIDLGRRRPTLALVARGPSRFFGAFLGRWFQKGRLHARRRGRRLGAGSVL